MPWTSRSRGPGHGVDAFMWIPGVAGVPTNVGACRITNTFLVTVIKCTRKATEGRLIWLVVQEIQYTGRVAVGMLGGCSQCACTCLQLGCRESQSQRSAHFLLPSRWRAHGMMLHVLRLGFPMPLNLSGNTVRGSPRGVSSLEF